MKKQRVSEEIFSKVIAAIIKSGGFEMKVSTLYLNIQKGVCSNRPMDQKKEKKNSDLASSKVCVYQRKELILKFTSYNQHNNFSLGE